MKALTWQLISLFIIISFILSFSQPQNSELPTGPLPARNTQNDMPVDLPEDFSLIYLPIISRKLELTELVYIPPGEFRMGCDPNNNMGEACSPDEIPVHMIYLDGFYIDKYEVSNFQYSQCVGNGYCAAPTKFSSETRISYYDNPLYANYPVFYVSWYDADTYCSWVDERLPTEAEWEKAARGIEDTRPYPWGDQYPNCSLANHTYFDGSHYTECVGDTAAVNDYPRGVSPYGVYNMAGNVWEWVHDWYQNNYYLFTPYVNPLGPDQGTYRVLRGGYYNDYWITLRLPRRISYFDPDTHINAIGFRCAVSANR